MTIREYCQRVLQISRRNFAQLVNDEKILLNGKKIESYGKEYNDGDVLEIADPSYAHKVTLTSKKFETSKLIAFNKPTGCVVSKSDPHNTTIYKILPPELKNFYYLGRLDKDSHGLLLLTNDPKLVNERSHPSKNIDKEYVVKLDKKLTKPDRERCLDGVEDEGEILSCTQVSESIKNDDDFAYSIVLCEGKNRHIRRMFAALGYEVRDLQRIRDGEIELGNLQLGKRKNL